MALVTIRNLGGVGATPDVPDHRLPPEAWTTVQNVGFEDGYAYRQLGESQVEGTASVSPHYVFPGPNTTASYWVYTDLASVYSVAGGVHTDITRSGGIYTGTLNDKWTGGWLNGVLVLNNGVNDPQQWSPISPGTQLSVLSNWPTNTKAKVIRVFQEFVLALDITESSNRLPTTIWWSHPADPGTVPDSWDINDATKLAGRRPVGGTAGFLVDAAPVGDSLMVWKEDSVHRFDRVASNQVFSRRRVSNTGLMAIGCAQEFSRGQQVALTIDADVVVTDGQQVTSITNRRIRKYLESFISGADRDKCFVVSDMKSTQVFICYPKEGSVYCNEAAVWNWSENVWSFQEITETLDIKSGIYDETAPSTTWDSDTETWDSDTTSWNERAYVATSQRMIGAYPLVGQLREFHRGQKLGTTAYTSKLERTGLAIVGMDRQGAPVVDTTSVKQVTELYPIIDSVNSMDMQVSVGAQDNPNGAITWDGPYDFDPLVDEKIDCFAEGRYIAVRFESSSEVNWKMEGYGMKVDRVGEYY